MYLYKHVLAEPNVAYFATINIAAKSKLEKSLLLAILEHYLAFIPLVDAEYQRDGGAAEKPDLHSVIEEPWWGQAPSSNTDT